MPPTTKKKFESKIPKMPWEIKRSPVTKFTYKAKKNMANKELLIKAIQQSDAVCWIINEGENEDGTVFHTVLIDGVTVPPT